MIFKKMSLHIVISLDPAEGACYTEAARNEDSDNELECIYQVITQDRDQMNLTTNGRISWECDISYTSNSNEEIELW